MARIEFRKVRLNNANKQKLELVNNIISEYQAQGYTLTLRQLYYQLVSRDYIPNKASEYGKLSVLLKEGRMGGIVDWSAIEDRLRQPSRPPSWDDPKNFMESVVPQYSVDHMEGQPIYLEVWVEKDALSGVLKRITEKYHIRILVNRGYSSASSMYDSFMRFVYNGAYKDRPVKILYLGDFDPSGLDMIRDIQNRITEFQEGYNDGYAVEEMEFSIDPIALTMDQIKEYNPPPNPAKLTDTRASEFVKKHGYESWEVDALRPEVLNRLLEDAILEEIDEDLYKKTLIKEEEGKRKLKTLTANLDDDEEN